MVQELKLDTNADSMLIPKAAFLSVYE